jgi:MFS family permease
MINKLQQHRKLIAVILFVSSALIISPIVAPEDNLIVDIFGLLIMIQNIIVSGILFFKGVVSASKVLTYSIVFITSIAVGLVLNFTIVLPESVDQSGLTTGVTVLFHLAFTMMFPLHIKIGNWVNSKLDPAYRTPLRPFYPLSIKSVNHYVHMLYNRNSSIVFDKPYAYENASLLNRKVRNMSALIGMILWVLLLIFTIYVDFIWKYFGDVGVYLAICLAFGFGIMGFSVMIVGFIRSLITLAICLVLAAVLGLCILALDWIYKVSQFGFIVVLLSLCCLAGYLFARFIIGIDVRSTRNFLTIYEEEDQIIGFSETISRHLPLKDYENLIKITISCPNDPRSKSFVKMTDRIRTYCMRNQILFVGWDWTSSTKIVEFVFYAQHNLMIEKLRKFIKRRVLREAEFVHEEDPTNQYYRDHLVPDREKMIEILNEADFKHLIMRKFDFTRTYEVRFACFIEDQDARNEFVEIAKQMGYGESIYYDEYIILTKNLQIELNQLNQICKKFNQLSNLYGGTFEGWSL